MSKLNRDVFYSIFEESQDDKSTLYSCLLVDKTWCEMVVPVLWKDPWKSLNERKMKLLLNVIISHLPTESRNNLSQRVNFLTSSYDKPFFDYISFCKHLNLSEIEKMLEKFQIPDIKEEIFDLF